MIDTNLEKIGIFRAVPFRYREVGDGLAKEVKVVRYVDGPYYDIQEPSTGPKPIRIQALFSGMAADLEKLLFMFVADLPGPGLLIHPDFGVSMAYCTRADVSKDGAIDGRIIIDCEFLPVVTVPGTQVAFAAAVVVRAAAIRLAALVRFTAGAYLPDGSIYESSMKGDASAAASALDGAMVGVLGGSAAASWTAAVGNLSTVAAADIGSYFQDLIDLVDNVDAARSGLDSVLSMWTTARLSPAATTARAALNENRAILYETIALGFLRRACVLAIEAKYETYDDAATMAKAVYVSGRSVVELMAAPNTIRDSVDLLGLTVQGMAVEALKLPQRVDFETPAPVSTLELAWALYGDYTRADEIAENNAIVDPGTIDLAAVQVLTK